MSELLSPNSVGVKEDKGPSKGKTADEINDIFNDVTDDKTEDEPIKKTPKETPPDEDDRDSEEDDDLELVDDEEDEDEVLDLKTPETDTDISVPPRKKEILKEYPEIFKKFPFLEKMLYRDKQYSELFGSFDDAKEIAESAQNFKHLEDQLLSGNTEEVLSEIREADPKVFDSVVDNYLPTLYKVDKEAYFHVVNGVTKRLIVEMASQGKKDNNDKLTEAALIINQFLFNTNEFTPHQNRTTKSDDNPEKREVEEERLNFVRERFETSRDEMQGRVDNKLRATISEYIDPSGRMSSYVKKNAVSDAMKHLRSSLANDTGLVKSLDQLWRTAFDTKFSRESLSHIESFYLGRAKRSLKNAIIKARSEALKDSSPREKKNDDKDDEVETPRRRGTIQTGRPSQPKASRNEMKKGETVAEFLSRD